MNYKAVLAAGFGAALIGTPALAMPVACCLPTGECFDTFSAECSAAGGQLFQGISCSQAQCERAHPGWNHVSTEITLTKNEPAYWSAFSGQPKGVAPWTVLDPGNRPGRPANDGSDDRVLRGYVVAWAVNSNNEEIRWNHLKGDAVVINYRNPYAWEYNAWGFQAVGDVAHGEQTGDPGVLNLDGAEYAAGFDQLLLDFYASGSSPFNYPNETHYVGTEITLHPISTDLRQEDEGPVTTKAKIDIWNENEVKFNGMERCITCWDATLIRKYSDLGVPNNFLYTTLQTNKGKARIDGLRSDNCDFDYEFDPDVPFGLDPRDIVSQDASLLGLSAKYIQDERLDDGNADGMSGSVSSSSNDGIVSAGGRNIFGMGTQSAVIRYDVLGETPESASTAERFFPRNRSQRRQGRVVGGATEGVAATQDRVSATEKGSLLIFSNVEVRWDQNGELVRDTFLDITNDFGEDVTVQMYFINGDAPAALVLPAIPD